MLGGFISPGLPKAAAPSNLQEVESFAEESCVNVQAQRQDRSYGDGRCWTTDRDGRRSGAGAEVQPAEALYLLPHIWPPYIPAGHKVYRWVPSALGWWILTHSMLTRKGFEEIRFKWLKKN